MNTRTSIFFILLFLFSGFSFSKELSLLGASSEDFNVVNYFTIKYDPRVGYVDLLNFQRIDKKLPQPKEDYDRKKHFGTWVHPDREQSCLNTRAVVLVRESSKPVTMTSAGCTVQTGEWLDPYTADTLIEASEIQIDHLVPLKNAYMTGAFEWTKGKRCLYANYLGNNFHLLAVSSHENETKSDQTPMGYVPPNKEYVCEYLKEWLKVKMIWSLRLTPKEVDAIAKKANQSGCDRRQMKMTAKELAEQRQYMEDQKDLCTNARQAL